CARSCVAQGRGVHGVVYIFGACSATFADRIEIHPGAGSCGGYFVMYFEAAGFGREQFVARVFVRFRLLRGERGRPSGGLLSARRCTPKKQKDSGNRSLLGHAVSLQSPRETRDRAKRALRFKLRRKHTG